MTHNKKKPDIDIAEDELDLRKAKAKISMWIDGDVLEAIREETKQATGSRKGYQTYLNQCLKDRFIGNKKIAYLEDLEELKQRVKVLEKAVGR